ncbi:hypothetical protein Tco_0848884, partial [Tanacetum coccineum]
EIVARERERKARTTLLMALPEDHLAKFHKMTDAKEMWDAIKSRFGGNDESKKMQKYILKQQFEGFSVSNTEGLHKGYDRSLPSAWSQVSLIMRTKPGVDSLSFDDLYNNLRVFESDIKGSTASSSSPQNVAFVSENTSSTNDISTAYCVPNPSGQNSKYEQTSSYSLLANQSSCPQLDHEDLEQIDEYDLEEMDLKWQVAMISMRMKKFYKKTGRKLQFDAKEPVGFDKTKGNQDNRRRDAWNSGTKDGSRTGQKEDSKALVTIDGEGVDWTNHSEDEDYALMACNSSDSDTEREQLSDASIEIKAYSQGLKKVEAQLVAHQQGQLWYEQKIKFMKIDLDDKTDVLTYHKKLLAEAQKEKEDLKAKCRTMYSTVLLNMSQAKAVSREKEKGVELKDIEETDRPRPTSTRSLLTLKPLPNIDPKDKGKKKIEEEDESESESDDRLLAERLQEQEIEQFTIEERAKFLHDTIAAQRKFLAQQRSKAIRNRPPTKNQLRNQMMTYLKHIKRSDEDFISIGSAEDERLIKRMNEKGVDSSKSEVIKEENKEEAKEENKEEESTRKRKLSTRKKMKSRKRRYMQNTSEDDSEKENDELRLHLTIAPDEEKEVDYEILDRKYPIKEWRTKCLGTKPPDDKAENLEEINQNVVIRSNGQKIYFSTLMRVLSIFDREDLNAVLADDEDKFWNLQQDWNIVSWKLHSSSGVHTLVTETGLVIHMLVEKKYPLIKKVMVQMLNLKLESEEDSTMALELIRCIKKLLAELKPED